MWINSFYISDVYINPMATVHAFHGLSCQTFICNWERTPTFYCLFFLTRISEEIVHNPQLHQEVKRIHFLTPSYKTTTGITLTSGPGFVFTGSKQKESSSSSSSRIGLNRAVHLITGLRISALSWPPTDLSFLVLSCSLICSPPRRWRECPIRTSQAWQALVSWAHP